MLHVYRHLANRVGTNDALSLAHDLSRWHDQMVRHERTIKALGFSGCDGEDDCPHAQARELWRQAQDVFGSEAEALAYLSASAAVPLSAEGV
ncbi:MAG: hypothetical protein AB7Q16_23745 [Vicinamibacterales bacterium]